MSYVAEALLPRRTRPIGEEGYVAISLPFQLATGSGDSDEIRSLAMAEYKAVVALLISNTGTLEQLFREFMARTWVADLAKHVRVAGSHSVWRYLIQHPDLMAALREIVVMVKARPEIDDVFLSVHRDPEIEDEYLALEIRQHSYGEQTLDLLESLQNEAERLVGNVSGWILITTDFMPPDNAF